MMDVIGKQAQSLQELRLSGMYLSSVNTEKFLTRFIECGVCNYLQTLILEWSTNFDSDESAAKLADILAIAPNLQECDIRQQQGNRIIKVVIEYATEERMGSIIIKDRETKAEIHRREIDK